MTLEEYISACDLIETLADAQKGTAQGDELLRLALDCEKYELQNGI